MTHSSSDIPAEIRAHVARQNVSINDVAAAIGKTRTTASRKLAGTIPLYASELLQIADLLGVELSDFTPTRRGAA